MEYMVSPYVVPIWTSSGISVDSLATDSWQYTPYILYEEKVTAEIMLEQV
jgi:hypothetical protein